MSRRFKEIIEIPCEESSKAEIESRVREYLVDKKDYIDGNILVKSDRFEAVDVIFFEECGDISKLKKALFM